MNNMEVPKGLIKLIEDQKNTPEYKIRDAKKQIVKKSMEIIEDWSEKYRERWPEHGKKVGPFPTSINNDRIVFELQTETIVKNECVESDETTLKIAVNPRFKEQEKQYEKIFTIIDSDEIKNKTSEVATLEELECYVGALTCFETRLKEYQQRSESLRSK